MPRIFQCLLVLAVFSLSACGGAAGPTPKMTTVPGDELTAETCLQFTGETYCPVWETTQGNMRHVEYLKAGDTVESWQEMVTVRRYGGDNEIKGVIDNYVAGVRPMISLPPEFYTKKETPHEEQFVLFLVLKAPDNSVVEVVTNSFYHEGDGVVWSVFHSYRMPYAQEIDFTDVMDQKGEWMDGVSGIDAKSLLGEGENTEADSGTE